MHESGIVLILGLLIGYLMRLGFGQVSKFDQGIFFDFMLPLIVFGAGYNMKRKRFFRNIGTIAMLGIFGTIITFLIIGVSTYYWSQWGYLYDLDGKPAFISLQEGLMIGATLSATDVVCTLALVKEESTPRLHSILFGESTTNDAVAIILLATLQKVSLSDLSSTTYITMVLEFSYICTASIIVGILSGVIGTLILKHFRSLHEWPSRETALLLYVSWMGYIVSELLEISGVISILVCSIVTGNYSYDNMSEDAQILTHNFYHFISDAAESLVFAYLGLTSYSYGLFSIPFGFLGLMFVSTLAARLVSTFALSFVVQVLTCRRHCLGFKNLSMICIGGIVRGGISFALALTFTGDNSEVIQGLILAFVMVGTVVCGTVLPLWVQFMDVREVGSVVGCEGGVENSSVVVRWWDRVNTRWIRKWLVIKSKVNPMKNIESTPELDRSPME